MNIVIRADASTQLGSGHVMRCLTLAHMLKRAGADVAFVGREMPAALKHLVSQDFRVHAFKESSADTEQDARMTAQYLDNPGKADWIVVDNYSLGVDWEKLVRPHVERIMVIDDLANRAHDCDVLLDQNLCPNFDTRYDALVPAHARKLLGPNYALLRPEFYDPRGRSHVRDGHVRSMLISFGGADPTNETAKAIEAMLLLGSRNMELEVVLGGINPQAESISNLCSKLPQAKLHHSVSNMAELMSKADLAIGAPGATTWERCILGLPAVTIVLASNQRLVGESVSAFGATVNLGWHSEVTPEKIAVSVTDLQDNPHTLREMGKAALRIMQGNGDASHQEILEAILNWKEQDHGNSN